MADNIEKVVLHCNLVAARAELLKELVQDGRSKVVATFEGSSDEGWFDSVTVDGMEDEVDNYDLRSFLHELVSSVMCGWEDGEGGGGKVVWVLRSDKITISGGYYERVRDDSSWVA
jgi:hypothetical protein